MNEQTEEGFLEIFFCFLILNIDILWINPETGLFDTVYFRVKYQLWIWMSIKYEKKR